MITMERYQEIKWVIRYESGYDEIRTTAELDIMDEKEQLDNEHIKDIDFLAVQDEDIMQFIDEYLQNMREYGFVTAKEYCYKNNGLQC